MTIIDHHSASESFLKHVENEVSDPKASNLNSNTIMKIPCIRTKRMYFMNAMSEI